MSSAYFTFQHMYVLMKCKKLPYPFNFINGDKSFEILFTSKPQYKMALLLSALLLYEWHWYHNLFNCTSTSPFCTCRLQSIGIRAVSIALRASKPVQPVILISENKKFFGFWGKYLKLAVQIRLGIVILAFSVRKIHSSSSFIGHLTL